MQFLIEGRYVANVVDGKVILYEIDPLLANIGRMKNKRLRQIAMRSDQKLQVNTSNGLKDFCAITGSCW
jgi:hypothetical protein